MKKSITAIVVTWNSRELIPDLARTLIDIEPLCNIVISDNASSDSTVESIMELIPGALILKNEINGGFGYGNNRALEVCDSEYVLLLNSDASISLSSLEMLVDTLEKDTGAAGAQPLIRLWDWPLVTLSAGAAMTEYGYGYDFDFMHFQPCPDTATTEVPCVTAALSLFRTEALRKTGGFDENIFMYFEDVDLCLRLRALGYRFLLNPESTGYHIMGASSSRGLAETWELQSSAYLTRKFLGGISCRLPDYWKKAEFRTIVSRMHKGRSWFWRLSALRKIRKIRIEHVPLPRKFLMWLLTPRPLRMPYPRSTEQTGETFPGSDVTAGPGWRGMKIDSCGFGCIEVPDQQGILTFSVRSCNIPGSIAIWSEEGSPSRFFLNSERSREISVKAANGVKIFYLVPDRNEQIVELENVKYTRG